MGKPTNSKKTSVEGPATTGAKTSAAEAPAKNAAAPAARKKPVKAASKPAAEMAGKTAKTTEKSAARPARAKTAARGEPVSRKSPASPRPKSGSSRQTGVVAAETIALRAYYISEKRRNLGIPGDPAQDWIEAEAQLIAETRV